MPIASESQAVGHHVKAMRLGARLTLTELATLTGLSVSTLSRFESGTRSLSNASLAKVTAAIAEKISGSAA